MPFSLPYGAREDSAGRVGENHRNEVALPFPFSITRFNFFCLQVLLTRAPLLALAKSIYYLCANESLFFHNRVKKTILSIKLIE